MRVSRSSLTKKLARLYPEEMVAIRVRGFESKDAGAGADPEGEGEEGGRSGRLLRGRSAGGSHDLPSPSLLSAPSPVAASSDIPSASPS